MKLKWPGLALAVLLVISGGSFYWRKAQFEGDGSASLPSSTSALDSNAAVRADPVATTGSEAPARPALQREGFPSQAPLSSGTEPDATILQLRARGEAGDFEKVMALARQLANEDPSEEEVGEAMFWLNSAVVLGSSEAAILQGELCVVGCFAADAEDPGDYKNWSMAATYFFLAYLMGDEQALRRLAAVTPSERSAANAFDALGRSRLMLQQVAAARAQRGLGPLNLDLKPRTQPLPFPPRGNPYLQPPSPTGG